MASTAPNITAEDVANLHGDGSTYELYEGMLVRGMTYPGHGVLCHRLSGELFVYARATGFPNAIAPLFA